MPYKDDRVRKDYHRRMYLRKKSRLLRKCPICKVRECSYGDTCRNCSKAVNTHGMTWARKTALVRDDHTCQICGLREIGLVEVDHILSVKDRPDLYTHVDNLMVLCPNCHKRKTIRDRKI